MSCFGAVADGGDRVGRLQDDARDYERFFRISNWICLYKGNYMWERRCAYLGVAYGNRTYGDFTNQTKPAHGLSPRIRKTMGMNMVTGH